MLKLVALALLVVAAIAAPQCGCEDTIAALEKRVAFLESRLDGVVGNSEFLILCLLNFLAALTVPGSKIQMKFK